jgi:pimeloyl-ACP methyl ester carboxylesterase
VAKRTASRTPVRRAYDAGVLHHVRTGNGPPLLLAHGIGMSHRAFDGVTKSLAPSFDVVAVDLPGFGASPPLRGTASMRALAEACAGLMASLGHERFHVAGNSLGGGIALWLALAGRVDTASALSPVGFMAGADRALAQVSLHAAYAQARLARSLMRTVGRAAPIRRALVRQYAEHGDRVPADRLAESFGDLAGATGFIATTRGAINWRAPATTSLPCPVTVAWGEHDRLLLTRPQSGRARERLPTARHVVLPDCGHLPAWDDPALVASVIAEAAGER